MNKTLETVGAVHTHTHTSQFLNKRDIIVFSAESAFCGANFCTKRVASVLRDIFNFINCIEDS